MTPKPTFALKSRLIASLTWERLLCRAVAAWCFVAAYYLLSASGYDTLSFAQARFGARMLLEWGILFLLFSIVSAFLGKLHFDSWALYLAATVCVVRWITAYNHKNGSILFVLAVASVYLLFTLFFLRSNRELFAGWKKRPRAVVPICVAALGILTATVLIVIGVLRYRTFAAPNYDFGIFCNMFYNMKESGIPVTTCERDGLLSHFAVHISPIYYLLLPAYMIFPTPETLQIGQAVFLAAGVFPTWLLARHYKLSGKATVAVCVLYALYPALSAGTFYDLHENCFLPFFLLFTFYFLEERAYYPMYFCAVCVLCVKEDAAFYLLIFALYLIFSRKNVLNGAILALLSVGWFVGCSYLLREYGTGVMVNRYDNLIYDPDDGLIGAIKTALVNPGYLLTQLFSTKQSGWEKFQYLLEMFLPLGFLPFFTKKTSRWLLVSPILFNLLTMYVYQFDIGFQYSFAITAFLIYATIGNLAEIRSEEVRRTLLAVATVFCLCLWLFRVPWTLSYYNARQNSQGERFAAMETFLEETVPDDASVNASTFLLPHLANRSEIYEVHYHGNKPDVDLVVMETDTDRFDEICAAYASAGYTLYAELPGEIVILASPDYVS